SSQSSYISHFFLFILFLSYGALRNLPSFPTRRSSDLAVRHGRDELRRRVGDLEKQAVGVLRLLGVLPEEPEPPGPAPAQARAAEPPAAPAPSGNGQTEPGPSAEDLAITDYDSLSASQVVTRLEGLTPEELEAVRAYELAHRGRKTILNKVAQLQA